MKKLVSVGLLLCMSTAFADGDKYQKSPNTPEAQGKTLEVASKVGNAVVDVASVIFQIPMSLYESIVEKGNLGENYIELDLRDGDGEIERRAFRFSAEAFAFGSRQGDGGLVPVKISVSAQDGNGLTIDEARIGIFRMMFQDYGIKLDYFTFGHTKLNEYTTNEVSQYNHLNLFDVEYNDILWSSDKRKVDIVLGGYFSGGSFRDLESYGVDQDLTGVVFNMNASVGVRINDVYGAGSVIVEGYTKNMKFYDDQPDGADETFKMVGDVSRNGVQVVYKDAKSRFSITAGVAKETSDMFTQDDNNEVYIRGKYYFNR